MASVARFDDQASYARGSRAPRSRDDADGLAAFRLIAEPNHKHSLLGLIESEIIPRLMMAHANDALDLPAGPDSSAIGEATIAASEVDALAPLALQVEADALLAYVDAILARGVAVDTMMVDLLAPTARLLGQFWEDDRCDFVDVTMGLWRLQTVVHEIAARAPADRVHAAGGHRALFASMPGDQHDFGTVVIDELFRRGGWITDRLSEAATPELLKRVGAEWFDMVGLTISCDCHTENLASIIVAMRNVSMNPRVCIMIGGRVCVADPDLAARVGADGTARDAKLALKAAADLVRVRDGEMLVS